MGVGVLRFWFWCFLGIVYDGNKLVNVNFKCDLSRLELPQLIGVGQSVRLGIKWVRCVPVNSGSRSWGRLLPLDGFNLTRHPP